MSHRFPTPPCAEPDAGSPLLATGRPISWGVVSTGRIADTVVADLALLEDATLQAVSSRDGDQAAAFAARHGFVDGYGPHDGLSGHERLFADPAVEAVYIATPHAQHFAIARDALRAGKHVLCEKALTINASEAAELVALARTRGLFLMEAVWTRFLPSVHRALDLIDAGEIGDIAWIRADLGFPANYDKTWRLFDPEAGGGALLDLAVYPLTWALGALGFPQSVQAVGTLNDDGVDTQESLTLTYGSGAQAQLLCSLNGAGPREAVISGSTGFLRIAGPLNNPASFEVHPLDAEPRTETFETVGRNYVYELREATRCIQQGLTESPTMGWADSVDTLRLFDGVRNQLGVSYLNDRGR